MYRRLMYLTLLLTSTAVGATPAVRAGLTDVVIIDRDTGAAIDSHYVRGEYWIAGRPGAKYGVEVRNRTAGRLLAVMSVDGINVVSGASAAWDQAGYVCNPWTEYRIDGWRKNNSEVAAFTFTDEARSYAARTGRPANVGVIGIAVFRERTPRIAEVPAPVAAAPPVTAGAPAAATPPTAAPLPYPSPDIDARVRSAESMSARSSARADLDAAKLGTGHGEREASYVVSTEFERQQIEPNEIVTIHYDSLENLIAMGIVPRKPAWPATNPFPGSAERRYVPDPPG